MTHNSALENYRVSLESDGKNWSKRIKAKNAFDTERKEEVNELRRQTKELGKQAMVDSLTGLWNTRYFELRLSQEMAIADRTGRPLSLIVLDLDEFKSINDKLGHIGGDKALKDLAAILLGSHHVSSSELSLGKETETQVLRETDVVCRYGGDEATLILPETDLETAAKVAERIRVNTESQSGKRKAGVFFTTSLGVTQFIPGEERDAFFNRADQALYQAKKEGRNRVTVKAE